MIDILSGYSDMADRGVVCNGGDDHKQTQNMKIPSHDRPRDSMFTSWPSKAFAGSRAMLSFGHASGGHGSGGYSAFQSFEQEETGDEYWDEYFNQPEKKRRLSVDQVQFLERSFEADNKLEPERKVQLAKELGLQPRQIAVWFQNRRARWKTRQLETDYESLHAKYMSLRTDYDTLVEENEKLKAEVLHLKHNGLARDSEKMDLKSGDTNGYIHARPKETVADAISDIVETSFDGAGESTCSLRFDGLWNRVDDLHAELLPFKYAFPKIDDACCHPSASPFCNECPVEDHTFSFWSC